MFLESLRYLQGDQDLTKRRLVTKLYNRPVANTFLEVHQYILTFNELK